MQRRMFRMVLVCCGLLFVLPGVAQTIPPGSIERVSCKSDTSQQYALYIPKNFIPGKPSSLLIFFDPGSRGDMPVKLYQALADEYGVIMAGSYNSRNFNGSSSLEAFVAVYNDLVNSYTIDPKRVWLSGFSGGARAASSIAAAYTEVSGVIACGAGFAGTEELTTSTMKAYAAIVGDHDMNYGELLENSHFLSGKRINNLLLVFKGDHTWPPLTHTGVAIEWLLNVSAESERGLNLLQAAKSKLDSGYLFPAWMDAQQLSKINAYRTKAVALQTEAEQNKKFLEDKQQFEKASEEELARINEFSLVFSSMVFQHIDVAKEKWQDIAKAVQEMRDDKNKYRQLSGMRCFDHCTRSCQEQYYQLMSTKFYDKALQVSVVLSQFTPASATPYLMMARAGAANGKKKEAEKNLKEAIRKGLSFSKRIEEDELLLKLFSKEEIAKLFQ